ncbi:unnamed protein product [Phyllotreta striolata]|uniref:Serpin domain-containing protein n=1 Tax=Phyllotreta striolata TaxID=444603 RepID=A0A9N9THN9_PHYSR|nr:unnamed protein product [Phyllotreta striolata]
MKTIASLILAALLILPSFTQQQRFDISNSVNTFGINLLGETVNQGGDGLNIALSTYSVWTLMATLVEGARDNTLRQLQNTLRLPPNNKVLVRYNFQNLTRYMNVRSSAVNLETENAMFTNKEFPVKAAFEDAALQYYGVPITPVNFRSPGPAAAIINRYVARLTRNRIPNFVDSADLLDAQVFMASLLYFKGLWKSPFQRNATHTESFYDEKGNKIGDVEMMYQTSSLPFARLEGLNAHAVELPYGSDGATSMVLVLPFKGDGVAAVLGKMSRMRFSDVLQTIEDAARMYPDELIHLYLPKFKVSSNFNLNVVLTKIGIKDVFDYSKSNLLDMFDQYLYLSRLIQKAEIEVDEEGTIATAATGASFVNKASPARFRVNKPFLYFIVNKLTRSIVFAGKISNPNTLK